MRHVAPILLAIAGSAGGVSAQQDYFVANEGSDALGSGGAASPFRTVTRALIEATAQGDRIFIGAGVYRPVDGELFPFVLPDGISLIGPSGQSATIDGAGVFTPIVVVSSAGSTVLIQDLRLRGSGTVLEVFGNPADLVVRDCAFLGGQTGIHHDFAGAEAALTVERCTFVNLLVDGIYWRANAGAPGTHRIAIRDCVLIGGSDSHNGVDLNGTGDATLQLELTGNRIEEFTTGLALTLAVTASSAFVRGLIEGNSLTNNQDNGLSCSLTASGAQPASVTMDALLRDNSLSKNSDHGGSFILIASGAASQAFLLSGIQGNLVRKNGRSGLYFRATESGGGSCVATPDLGGGGASTGGNTLTLNDDEYSTGFEYDLRVESSQDVSARGNWWTILTDAEVLALGSAAIAAALEQHVFHAPDAPSSGLVDFGESRLGDLHFDPRPTSVVGDGLHRVTLVARPGSSFSSRVGATLAALTAESTAIFDYTVGADGSTLSFTMPSYRVVGGGEVSVQYEHPAGHQGQTTVNVLGTDQGNLACFVATAAYGDAMAEEVGLLRNWRDRCLESSVLGRWFVRGYYAASPPLARAIARDESRRRVARILLAPVVAAARHHMERHAREDAAAPERGGGAPRRPPS